MKLKTIESTMHLSLAQAEGGSNWVGITILIIIGLVVLAVVAGKFEDAYKEQGAAGVFGCLTTIIIIIVIRALIIYFREKG